jgi:hypothetical protein
VPAPAGTDGVSGPAEPAGGGQRDRAGVVGEISEPVHQGVDEVEAQDAVMRVGSEHVGDGHEAGGELRDLLDREVVGASRKEELVS